MAFSMSYLSLRKEELGYEIELRGEVPAATVVAMKAQIKRLAKDLPAEVVQSSHLEYSADVSVIKEGLDF